MFSINYYSYLNYYDKYLNYKPRTLNTENLQTENQHNLKYTTCKYDEFGNLVFLTFDAKTGELLDKYVVKRKTVS